MTLGQDHEPGQPVVAEDTTAGDARRDLLAGMFLLAVGLFALGYALDRLQLGSFRRMGPGMFPALVGGVLALIGAGIAGPALMRGGHFNIRPDWRALLLVLLGLGVFASTVVPFGVVPAIIALVVIASFANPKLSPVGVALLALGTTALCLGIFVLGFGVQVSLLSWPG